MTPAHIAPETERLRLRRFTLDDAAFAVDLVNQPGWLAHISDTGVRSAADARAWIERRMLTHYSAHGFGFWVVILRSTDEAIGMCGLFRRDGLDHPDLGYALLQAHEGQGYAMEAALACVDLALGRWGWPSLLAITSADNPRSARLLRALGFADEGLRELAPYPGLTRFWALHQRDRAAQA